jgi:hypothetical protein
MTYLGHTDTAPLRQVGSRLTMLVVLLLMGTLPATALAAKHRPKERKLDASFSLELSPPTTSLPATQTIDLFVPAGARDAGARLPFCDPVKLQDSGEGACPHGSLVGSGTANGYTLGVVEPLKLLLYNGPHAQLLTYVLGTSPVSIQVVVSGRITRPAGPYGQELRFTIPPDLLEPLPGDPAWLLNLHARLFGKVGWLRSSSCPPHGWSLKAKFGYTNGQTLAVGANLTCL